MSVCKSSVSIDNNYDIALPLQMDEPGLRMIFDNLRPPCSYAMSVSGMNMSGRKTDIKYVVLLKRYSRCKHSVFVFHTTRYDTHVSKR